MSSVAMKEEAAAYVTAVDIRVDDDAAQKAAIQKTIREIDAARQILETTLEKEMKRRRHLREIRAVDDFNDLIADARRAALALGVSSPLQRIADDWDADLQEFKAHFF